MTSKFEKNLFGSEGKDPRLLLVAVKKAVEAAQGELELVRLTDSDLQICIRADSAALADSLVSALLPLGFDLREESPVSWQPAPADGVAPEGFYSTTHHDTEILVAGQWQPVRFQRMDGCITERDSVPTCTQLRDLIEGDPVVVGMGGVRLVTADQDQDAHQFAFMSNEVSSERRVEVHTRMVADLARRARQSGKKVIWVPGPVIVHTGASTALSELVADGWVDAVLSGNALAVHDIEAELLGTSLGVSVSDGSVVAHGHSHHMRAINRIRSEGSIEAAVESGVLSGGLMHALVKHRVPYVLAGSIRDDGPLPETEMDLIVAQQRYAEHLKDAGLVIVLATMLHGIGVGNMLSARVPLVCVDIHPAVATKLTDRGSAHALGIVTDVGLFVRRLREELAV
ncbi:MAG: TIGR00300 family protein [Planctomycetota bacterium]|nr:TIGR00300 family protein [Planctomycetota bacterium]